MTNAQVNVLVQFKKDNGGFGNFTAKEVAEKTGLEENVVREYAQKERTVLAANFLDPLLRKLAPFCGLEVENFESGEKRKRLDREQLYREVREKLPSEIEYNGRTLSSDKILQKLGELSDSYSEWKFKSSPRGPKSSGYTIEDILDQFVDDSVE